MNTTPVNQPFHINPDGSVESGYSVPTGYPVVTFYEGMGEFLIDSTNTDWENVNTTDTEHTFVKVHPVDEDGNTLDNERTVLFRYVGSWGEPD